MKSKAMARLGRELKVVQDEFPPGVIDMFVCDSNLHEILFAIAGPEKTNFEGGVYVLKISLPKDYPYSPPDFIMYTPNGRFAPGAKICTSFSSFHPESWSPAYTITTLVVSFISFFSDEKANAAGVVHDPPATRKQRASESVEWGRKSQYAKKLKVFSVLKSGRQTEATLRKATAKIHGGEDSDVENKNGASGSLAAGANSIAATDVAANAAEKAVDKKKKKKPAQGGPEAVMPLSAVGCSAAQQKQRTSDVVQQKGKSSSVSASIDLTGGCAAAAKQKRPAGGSIDLTAAGASAGARSSAKVAKKASVVVDLT